MSRLRVMFITSAYPSCENPMQGVFVREHAKAVSLYNDVFVLHCAGRNGHITHLWSMGKERDSTLTAGIPTYRMWEKRLPFPTLSYLVRIWGVYQAYRHLTARGLPPDVIHANVYPVVLPSKIIGDRYRIPVVAAEHSSEFVRRLIPRSHLLIAKPSFEAVSVVMPVSQSLKQGMETYGINANYRIVPNTIDTDLFSPPNYRDKKAAVKSLLFVGSLEHLHKKGVPYLLESLKIVNEKRKDWQLDIIGDGPARQMYEDLAVNFGISQKVVFHGLKSRSDISKYMQRCQFLVQPSLYETFGVVLIEALATGTPVIATSCGGPAEFVTEEVGRLVPPTDIEALALAIDEMLDQWQTYCPEDLATYTRRRFSYEAVGKLLDQIYQNVITAK